MRVKFLQIEALAKLPSREGLLSILYYPVLQAPVRNAALAVKAVADQKDGSNNKA